MSRVGHVCKARGTMKTDKKFNIVNCSNGALIDCLMPHRCLVGDVMAIKPIALMVLSVYVKYMMDARLSHTTPHTKCNLTKYVWYSFNYEES